jgi:D-xylose transport system substrate-binding protein
MKMKNTVLIGILISLLSSFLSVLVGCKQVNKKSSKPLIGLSMDTYESERWEKDKKFFLERLSDLDADVIVKTPMGDDHNQLEQVNEMLNAGIDVLVILPVDSRTSTVIVEAAHKKGVKVIAYDRLIQYADVDLYLSFDNFKVGELQATYIANVVPKGQFAILGGSIHDNNSYMFKKGQMSILKPLADSGHIDIVFDDWATMWSVEEGKRLAQTAITQYPQLDAIIASNDDLAEGAITALAEKNLTGKVAVCGQDASLAACRRILAGIQTMTVYKPVKNLAHLAAELAVKFASKEDVTQEYSFVNNGKIDVPSILLEPITVDKTNLHETVVFDGFITPFELEGKKEGVQ